MLAWQTTEGQTVRVEFTGIEGRGVEVQQTFSADSASSVDEQRDEWQAVLDNFAHHVARVTA